MGRTETGKNGLTQIIYFYNKPTKTTLLVIVIIDSNALLLNIYEFNTQQYNFSHSLHRFCYCMYMHTGKNECASS